MTTDQAIQLLEKIDTTNQLIALNNAMFYHFEVIGGLILVSLFIYYILNKFY